MKAINAYVYKHNPVAIFQSDEDDFEVKGSVMFKFYLATPDFCKEGEWVSSAEQAQEDAEKHIDQHPLCGHRELGIE